MSQIDGEIVNEISNQNILKRNKKRLIINYANWMLLDFQAKFRYDVLPLGHSLPKRRYFIN